MDRTGILGTRAKREGLRESYSFEGAEGQGSQVEAFSPKRLLRWLGQPEIAWYFERRTHRGTDECWYYGFEYGGAIMLELRHYGRSDPQERPSLQEVGRVGLVRWELVSGVEWYEFRKSLHTGQPTRHRSGWLIVPGVDDQ